MSKRLFIDDLDAFSNIRGRGADLSSYQEQLRAERSARTLDRRRSRNVSIARIQNKIKGESSLGAELGGAASQFLDLDTIRSSLESTAATVLEFLSQFQQLLSINPRFFTGVLQLNGLTEPFVECLNRENGDTVNIAILNTIAMIYPKCGRNQESFIDDGLMFYFMNAFESENEDLVLASIGLVGCVSECSAYARDSAITFGIFQNLIDIASSGASQSLTIKSCESLRKMFENSAPIEHSVTNTCVDPVSGLLTNEFILSLPNAVQNVCYTLAAITNKAPNSVYRLFESGIYSQIVQLLDFPETVGAVIPLIGNMAIDDANHVRLLADANLLEKLFALISTEKAADVLWVLSNLTETLPYFLLEHITPEFVINVVNSGLESDFDTKKESVFFAATVILFSDTEKIEEYLHQTIVDSISCILDCGDVVVSLRCIDAIIRLDSFALDNGLTRINDMCDIRSELEILLDQSNIELREKAQFFIAQIEREVSISVL